MESVLAYQTSGGTNQQQTRAHSQEGTPAYHICFLQAPPNSIVSVEYRCRPLMSIRAHLVVDAFSAAVGQQKKEILYRINSRRSQSRRKSLYVREYIYLKFIIIFSSTHV